MSHVFDKSTARPQMRTFLEELQELLRKHDATISGTFGVHTRVSETEDPMPSEKSDGTHRRPDGTSLYHINHISADEIDRRY